MNATHVCKNPKMKLNFSISRILAPNMYTCVCVCRWVLPHHSSSLIVLQVHQCACVIYGALGVVLLTLSCVHKLPSEAVSVVDVVPTAAPQPVSRQLFGSSGSAASARRELAFPACSTHSVYHTGSADRICERCFPAAWRKHRHMQESEEWHNCPKLQKMSNITAMWKLKYFFSIFDATQPR